MIRMRKTTWIFLFACLAVAGILVRSQRKESCSAVFQAANSQQTNSTDLSFSAANDRQAAVSQSAEGETPSGFGGDGLAAETNSLDSSEQIARRVAAVPKAELRQAIERALKDNEPAEYRELLQRRWAEAAPNAAAAWVGNLTGTTNAIPLVQQTAIIWANKYMDAAVAWAGSLPQGETRTAAIIAVGYEATDHLPSTRLI